MNNTMVPNIEQDYFLYLRLYKEDSANGWVDGKKTSILDAQPCKGPFLLRMLLCWCGQGLGVWGSGLRVEGSERGLGFRIGAWVLRFSFPGLKI